MIACVKLRPLRILDMIHESSRSILFNAVVDLSLPGQ